MIIEKRTQPTAKPFTIRIFCPDGSPSGLRIIEKSNWSGRCLVCPKSLLPEIKNNPDYKSMFDSPGVYVLSGESEEEELPRIYVGEGDPVGPRLDKHYVEKDFWTWLAFFIAADGSLNKSDIQHFEAKLVALANDAQKINLDNDNVPQFPNLSLADKAEADGFLSEMLSIFPLIGLNVFEKEKISGDTLLHIDSCKINANGYETQDGFLVLEGSMAVLSGTPGISQSLHKLRKELVEKNVLTAKGDHMVFVQDYIFRTPATAAGTILGHPASKSFWMDENGMTLKELQEKRIGNSSNEPIDS